MTWPCYASESECASFIHGHYVDDLASSVADHPALASLLCQGVNPGVA